MFSFRLELDIIGQNSMVYDPVNNLPYPCDSEKKPTKKAYVDVSPRKSSFRFRHKLPSQRTFLNEESDGVYKRADGDKVPIQLQPCPFPNGTQEHRWLKSKLKMHLPH